MSRLMGTTRLEAFSDAVIAIVMTIMVLELKIPHEANLASLAPIGAIFASYVLSFVHLAIYWNNHHHMMQVAEHVDGAIMWANMHLLFWLSLIPFATGWMGENQFASTPTAMYGFVLLMSAVAYFILQRSIIIRDGPESLLAKAVGTDSKGKLSPVLYLIGIPLAFVFPLLSGALYVAVAIIWMIPDRRIEEVLPEESPTDQTPVDG